MHRVVWPAASCFALWALFACALAFGQTPDQTLFGPKQYLRTTGTPNQYSGGFAVPQSVGAPFLLRIVNGAANGEDRVTSGTVTLNGVQVVGPADFNQGVAIIERNVQLAPSNTLEVRLASKPGSYITLSVLGTRILPVPTSLAPNPLSVSAGATGTLTATLSPTPTSGGTLAVSSADPSIASVPASIAFAPGQSAVPIPVSAHAAGTTSITASANGGGSSATVNVTPALPTVTGLTPANLALTQGSTGTLTVTISAAQPGPTAIAIDSSNAAIASAPSSVSVAAGETSALVPVSALSPGSAQISAALNGTTASSQVSVLEAPPTPVSLLPALSTVTLGAGTTLTLTISSAQTTDTVVALSVSPSGIVTAPAEVTVSAGQVAAPVPVATLAYGQAGITASLNGASASAAINVVPPPIAITALEPASFTMTVGATSTFTVRINAAQTTNTEIALDPGNASVLQVPGSVIVAQGATSATFTATGLAVGDALITASANGTSRTSAVHVSPQPAAIVSLLPSPLPLQEGATGALTVTINVAQEVPTTIALANTVPAVATVPESVVIAAGAVTAQVPVSAVNSGATQISASANGTSASASVEVTPPPPVVTAVSPATLSLPKGTPGLLRAHVSRAPNVATTVTLVSSDTAIASVPPQVQIPAGALHADFPVTSNAVGQATITASLNGGAASSTVTVAAAELAALTLSPQTPTNYVGESVPFTATGTMTDGTTEDFTSRVTWTSSNTGVATIAAGGVATPLAVGETTIAASFSFTAVQTGLPVTIARETVLTVKIPTALLLTTPNAAPVVGQTIVVTLSTSDAPPFGGLAVSLAGSGAGAGSFPPTVTIPEYENSVTFEFTATAAGSYTLTASAQNRLPGTLALSIQPQFLISSFTPETGPVGTAVAIHGSGFDPSLSGNTVRFNGEVAVVASGSPTLLNAIVPTRATTGPITVANFRGTVASATSFTVQEREAFDIVLAPGLVQVPLGGLGSARIRLTSTGLNPYPYAASLAVTGLPAGVTATFDRAAVALNQDAVVTFNATAGAAAATASINVTATGASGVTTQIRVKPIPVQVLAAGSTTVSGRVLHADDGAPFVGARVRLATASVFTDESGTYRFVDPPVLGDQVLLIDGHTNNTPQFEYPSAIAMPAMIIAGQDNKVLTSYIQKVDATKFTTVVPGAAATVTDPDIPNFSLNIPQGATLFGWDGQPITKINVRTVPVDRLPIRPIPEGVETRNVYLFYFFREGGANPTTPIPVSMANDIDAAPGEQVTLWYYDESVTPDPNSNQWRVMGMGTVSEDGKTIVSNEGVGIPKFCCGAGFPARGGGGDTGAKGGDGCGKSTAYPVDLASGNATAFRPRPFGMSNLMAVDLNCRYRSTDRRVGLFGRGISFTYDWFAELLSPAAVRVTNPQGVQYTLSREADGVYRSRSGRAGAIDMEVTATSNGRTLRLADGTSYEFNSAGRLLAVVDLAGNRTTFQVDGQGFPVNMIDAAGKAYAFELVGTGNTKRISKITDPAGRFVSFTYDPNLRLATYRDQGGGLTQLAYDAANRISQVTDPRNAIKQLEYDAAGRTVREILPENSEERFAYTAVGRTVTETRHTDANGNVTTYRFSGLGYETSMVDALGRTTKTELDPVTNHVRRRIDPAGRVTEYFYNQRGDMIRTIDADGKQTLIEYDPRFRKPVRIENALGHVITLVYDAKGNLTTTTNAENETTSFTYTARGQLASITDPLARVTSLEYDDGGNLIRSTNTADESVTRLYDDANRLIELTDSLNRTTRFTYDSLDRITEVRDALHGLTRYAFDANDNLLSVHDQNGNPVERNVYDLRNRLTRKTDAKNLDTVYEYDGVGNPVRMTDRRGRVTEYVYDVLNRVIQVSDADGRMTTYEYEFAGNLARIGDSESGDLLMSYDVMNRMVEVVAPQGTVSYAYDAIGRRISRAITGGDVTTYSYDRANRLKTVSLRGKTATYNYDVAGRLIGRVLPNGMTVTYSYDAADRVTGIDYRKADTTPVETISYAYDMGGQRIEKALGTGNVRETPINAVYDEANRLAQVTIAGEVFNLSYDENGNLTSKSGPVSGTTSYTWNARNQLTSIAGPAGAASFRYDAQGRRIEKTVNGVTTGFLYDGAQAIAELKGSSLDSVYHTGLEIDEVLARYASLGSRTLLTDALMSVIAQANDDGSVANFYAYSPYGETVALGSDDGNPLQYTGRENDGTGLYYYRARYYDPVLNRFVSEDPIGFAGGINLYAYVQGNPLSLSDPLGLSPWDWVNEYGSVDLTFNAGTGVVGATGQISVTKSGITGYFGIGWGIGFGASLTGGANFGSSSGWGVTGSVSGGQGAGATASGTISQCGSSANIGVGLGVGAGASITGGYGGTIWSWD